MLASLSSSEGDTNAPEMPHFQKKLFFQGDITPYSHYLF